MRANSLSYCSCQLGIDRSPCPRRRPSRRFHRQSRPRPACPRPARGRLLPAASGRCVSKPSVSAGGQMILDLDGLAGVDQLLQTDFVACRRNTRSAAFSASGSISASMRVQLVDVAGKLVGHGGIALPSAAVFAHFLQLAAGGGGQLLEGIRPFPDDLVGFLLAVRPDGQARPCSHSRALLRLAGKAARNPCPKKERPSDWL